MERIKNERDVRYLCARDKWMSRENVFELETIYYCYWKTCKNMSLIKYETAEHDTNKCSEAKSCLRALNSLCIERITLTDPRHHLGAIWKIGDSLRSFRRRVLQSETTARLLFRTFQSSSITRISGQSSLIW